MPFPMQDLTDEPARTFGQHLTEIGRRTTEALDATGFGALLVHSGSAPMLFQDDQSYPFRAQAPFKLWVPLTDVPDCFMHFEPGKRPLLAFHRPTDYWYAPPAAPEGYWTPHFDIRFAADRTAARAALPADLGRTAFIGEPFTELAGFGVQAVNPEPLIAQLAWQRARKTPYELACLRLGSRSGARAHLAAARAFEDGASEFEIELAFLRAAGLREQELPYNPIIALNEGGAVLHYQLLERHAPAERHSLLIDAGTEYAGYATDITRTWADGDGDFSSLVEAMHGVQQTLCKSVRAGVDWRDVHLAAHRLIADLLRQADIIRVDAEEAVSSGLSGVFFPHGIGHLLGLQVHDVGGTMRGPEGGEIARPPGHPYLRLTRVLGENWVVTMEPGIYFIDQLLESARGGDLGRHINWPRVESLRRFGGIRIEDDLVAVAGGHENLTRDAFSALPAGPGSPAAAAPTS